MSKKKLSEKYQIFLGAEDVVSTKLAKGAGSPFTEEEVLKNLPIILKEIKVRIGTLLKSDNVSFLLGAGASICAGGVSLSNIPVKLEEYLYETAKQEGLISESETASGWFLLFYKTTSFLLDDSSLLEFANEVTTADFTLDDPLKINLESYLSQLHLWMGAVTSKADKIVLSSYEGGSLEILKTELEMLIARIKDGLTSLLALPQKDEQLYSHKRFIKKLLTRPLNLRRSKIFTLNYDTLIEQAADAEGVVLVDGFVGNLKRSFRPESYDLDFYFPSQTTEGSVRRFDRALHLYKLHGSLNWYRTEQTWENPYGFHATCSEQRCSKEDVLIYPSPLKYGETLGLPYSELFRRFGAAIHQPQSVLFVIGYGFGDEHINVLIRQALAIPSFTLVIIDPNPSNSFVTKLKSLGDERVWIFSGLEIGTFENFVEKLLPDLHEEEIASKITETFKALSKETGSGNV